MAIVHKQSQAATAASTSVNRAITPNKVGNLIVVSSGTAATSTISISDTATNTWNILVAQFNNGTSRMGGWWAAANGVASTTITCSAASTGSFINILIDEFDIGGTMAVGNVDQIRSGVNVVSLATSGNLAVANEAVWLACNDAVTAVGTIGGSSANAGANDGSQDFTEWLILSGGAGSPVTGTFTGTAAGANIMIATFIPAAVGAGWPIPTAGPSWAI